MAYISQTLLMSIAYGAVNFLFVALGIAARFMPGIAMASYMVGTTTVSEFMASMERMHIPQKITIPMSVMFRFFPTVGEEYGSIADAMRMRGIRFGARDIIALLLCAAAFAAMIISKFI